MGRCGEGDFDGFEEGIFECEDELDWFDGTEMGEGRGGRERVDGDDWNVVLCYEADAEAGAF